MTVAKTLTKAKSKATPKSKAAQAKTEELDLLDSTVVQIENLTKEDALTEASRLIEDAEFNYFKLGGVLSVIQENGWWEGTGHENFKAYIEDEFSMPYRKAMYLINIYAALVESGVKWEQVKSIGWTKLKDIAALLTKDNVAEWVKRADTMTALQLQEYIKAAKTGNAETGDEEETKQATVSTMTFKVHGDQKETIRTALDKGKEQNNTEYDTVALEFICMQYLEGSLGKKTSKPTKPASLLDLMKGSTPEEVLGVFEQVWPNIDLSVEMPEEV